MKSKTKRAKKTAKSTTVKRSSQKPLEERLLDLEEDEEELFSPSVSERMRQELLKQEFKLRKKQPTAWTKTKYRKFALFAFNRKKKDEKKAQEKLAQKNRLGDD